MAASQELMYKLSAPARIVTEGGTVTGVSDGLTGRTGYNGTLTVRLVAPFPTGSRIHYTLDGTDPTAGSPVYTRPLRME
jgi:hypothetical protein